MRSQRLRRNQEDERGTGHPGAGTVFCRHPSAGNVSRQGAPPIRVVGNSWISLIAYQAKGYAYIAP